MKIILASNNKGKIKEVRKVLGDDFHTYGMLWDRNKMAFTCDGKIYCSYDITQTQEDVECFNHTLYLILSMAVYFDSAPLAGNATPEQWQTTNKFITDMYETVIDKKYRQ